MRYVACVLALVVSVLFIPWAFSQDAMMELKHQEIQPHERAVVQFNHEKHSNSIECLRCHHDYDNYYNNKGGEGVPCAQCHAKPSDNNSRDALTRAFHGQCKGCHEFMQAAGKPTGPIMCGECHVKK